MTLEVGQRQFDVLAVANAREVLDRLTRSTEALSTPDMWDMVGRLLGFLNGGG
jgi:hypothetical protein